MQDFEKNFTYLSQIINLPVIDTVSRKKVGRIVDVSAGIYRAYPKVTALIIRSRLRKNSLYIPWKNVTEINEKKGAYIEKMDEILDHQPENHGSEMLLKETFWDNQIVDTAGSKVVRVNDVNLMRDNENLWVVHIDVGFTGILRRLGFHRYVQGFVKWLFDYDLKDKFISWKNIQPITTTNIYGSISLKMSYSKLSGLHPADLADILAELGTDERLIVIRSLDRSAAARALQEMPQKIKVQTTELLDEKDLKAIIEEMEMDEIVDLCKELSEEKLQSIFEVLSEEDVNEIRNLLLHSERSAGSLMNTEFISVKETAKAVDILKIIKSEIHESESIYYIYVVTDDDSLVGVTTLRQLLVAKRDKKVRDFMHENTIRVKVGTDVRKVAKVFFKYDFMMVPVVDDENRLKGVITIKDALEAVFPEMKEESD